MPRFVQVLTLLSLMSPLQAIAAQHHVTTSGSSSGTGSLASPWSLTHALSHPSRVVAGDTIWVHAGTYPGQFKSMLRGTSSRPIIVRNYRGGRATLEDRTGGGLILAVAGGYTWFWGLEVRSAATNLTNSSGVVIGVPGIKCINLIVHDCLATGINPFKDALDAEVYGSLIYYNGRQKERGGGAYGSYVQNVTGKKLFRDNIYHHNWSYAIHAYESGGADLDNMTFEGNAIFNNGLFYEANKFRTNLFVGGDAGHKADNNVFRNNYTFYSPTPRANQRNVIGHTTGASNTTMQGNFWISPGDYAMMLNSTNNTITGNVFLGKLTGLSSSGYPSNTYYSSWPSRPDDIFVRANRYESGRAHVYAYNWDQSGSIEADLSSVLDPGDKFEIRDAMNYFGSPIVSGTYSSGTTRIPMTGLSVASPLGRPVTSPIHPAPRFGAFIVVTTSGVTASSPGTPSLSSPANGSSNQAIPLTLRWNQAANANDYEVECSENNSFESLIVDAQTGGATSYSPDDLLYGRTYYWRVRSRGPGGQSAWSTPWSFTTIRNTASSLPVNGGFESGTSPWRHYHNGGSGNAFSVMTTPPVPQGAAKARVSFGATIGTNNQLYQSGLSLEAATAYRITFAYHASASTSFRVRLIEQDDDYTVYGFAFRTVNATTGIQNFTHDFTTSGFTGTVTDAMLQFYFVNGTPSRTIYLDNVVIAKLGAAKQAVEPQAVPAAFELMQNYPNPFNPSTTIRYALAEAVPVRLTVYNSIGELVATLVNEAQEAGVHETRFDGRRLSSGVYFYRVQAGDFVATKRLMILK